MEIAFSISTTENKLIRGLNTVALLVSLFPKRQKNINSKHLRSFPFRKYIVEYFHREFDTMYFAFKGMSEELEKRIETITPEQAQKVLEVHRKVKSNIISIRVQLEKVNFIDDKDLEHTNRLCLDLCYDIEYTIRKRANINSKKIPSELSKLVAEKTKYAVIASL
jgi:hypothetical protein